MPHELAHLRLGGRLDALKRVEILSADGVLLRAARVLSRWHDHAPLDGTFYWPAARSSPDDGE